MLFPRTTDSDVATARAAHNNLVLRFSCFGGSRPNNIDIMTAPIISEDATGMKVEEVEPEDLN